MADDEVRRLRSWVNDLQAGMYINCVYCGHRYGPDDEVPASMADVLKEHVEQCPDHPMSALKDESERLRGERGDVRAAERAYILDWLVTETLLYPHEARQAEKRLAALEDDAND